MFWNTRNDYRGNDEFSGKKANSWQSAVRNKRERCKWVNDGVNVCHPLKPFKAATSKSIPEWTMSTQENLNGSKSPPENLVQPIGQVDWCRAFECRPHRHAVNGPPSSAVHFETRQNILSHWPIYPPNLGGKSAKHLKDQWIIIVRIWWVLISSSVALSYSLRGEKLDAEKLMTTRP